MGLHARSPLLRLQSDERLIALIRRGSTPAFEVLVARYHSRLLAFCRHLLGSREDAEDVLQEVLSAAFNAILDDDRPINVRPWLYRIARNRSLNHLRRIQAVGVDSMDIHLHDHGATTADKVHEREEFRLLVGDIHSLPETQRTALVLREMDALSYEQISEAMETTVPSVKSLLVRARVSLAEASEARLLSCEQVREELGEVAEGLRRRPGPLVRRHLRTCQRCSTFKGQLNETSKALTALLPIGPFVLFRKLALLHLGHSAGAGSSASGASAAGQAAAVGSTAAAGATAVMGSTTGGFLSASVGAIATKAVAGLAAAALVTAGAVEVEQPARPHAHPTPALAAVPTTPAAEGVRATPVVRPRVHRVSASTDAHRPAPAKPTGKTAHKPPVKPTGKHAATTATKGKLKSKTKTTPATLPGRTQTQTDPTVLALSTTPTTTSTPTSTATTGCSATPSPTTTTTSSSTSTAGTEPSGDAGSGDAGSSVAGSGDAGSGDAGGGQDSDTSTTPSSDTSTTSSSDTSSDSGTTTSPTQATPTTPAAESDTDSGCASDSSGSSGTGQPAPSGGAAP
jgi:RNA polymerase sigma factor (sigma-70 family)